ncbi:MAG: hypothetical protein HOI53_05700 [Francisellaceae bacterium]|jgi:hypothetical protein|nr:hypothetical protein [Francisellaceae bacterium]MBT6207502.1 hypothetical protein [Francisellaceae bacterium]MBT6538873.1 hypothetical protein [Francisellaceae bacterium]
MKNAGLNRLLQMQAVRVSRSERGVHGIMMDVARDISQTTLVNGRKYTGASFQEKFSKDIDVFWAELFQGKGLSEDKQNIIKRKMMDYLTQSGLLEADREALMMAGIGDSNKGGAVYNPGYSSGGV